MVKRSSPQGFTLIELMIVVAIIGVLAAIVYPSYQSYVISTNRVDMMTEMQQIASRIEANKITYKRYDNIPLSTIFSSKLTGSGSVGFPATGTALYTITVTPNDGTTLGGRNWTITAQASASMTEDGNLTLNNQGEKCRIKGLVKKCGTSDEWRQ